MEMMFLMIVVSAVVGALIGAAIFQWLWNMTMPETFNLKQIRYWVALRLLVMATILSSGGFRLRH